MEKYASTYHTDSEYMKIKTSSREISFKQSDKYWQSACPDRDLFTYLLFLILPASLCGCISPENHMPQAGSPESSATTIAPERIPTRLYISDDNISSLDVFIFGKDRLERLDSYQKFDDCRNCDGIYGISSCTGEKIAVLLANNESDRYEWIDINCRKSLYQRSFDLESESPSHPIMTGEYTFEAGHPIHPELTPLSAEIILRSIRTDFSEEAYAGEYLEDVKVYLTNVNASCGIISDGEVAPSRIINCGRLNEDDIMKFNCPDIIFQTLEDKVGNERIFPEIRLRTYPCSFRFESIGTPYTKLVIEGRLKGNTCYYPIAINRSTDSDDAGVRRNRRYIYDLTITRAGLADPDGVIEPLYAEIELEVEKWKEKEWYDVRF